MQNLSSVSEFRKGPSITNRFNYKVLLMKKKLQLVLTKKINKYLSEALTTSFLNELINQVPVCDW